MNAHVASAFAPSRAPASIKDTRSALLENYDELGCKFGAAKIISLTNPIEAEREQAITVARYALERRAQIRKALASEHGILLHERNSLPADATVSTLGV